MDTRKTPPRFTTKFDPLFKWTKDDESETLVLSLPGFSKEQLRVQMDNSGNLRVSGERPLTNDQWSSFRRDFRVPKNTNAADIHAKIEDGNLYIKFHKPYAKPQRNEQNAKEKDRSMKPNEPEPDRSTDKIITAQKQGGVLDNLNRSGAGIKTGAGKDEAWMDESKMSGRVKEKEDESRRKRKAENESGSEMKLMKRQRQLLANVGVALVVLAGLTFYVSYKLKKTIGKGDD